MEKPESSLDGDIASLMYPPRPTTARETAGDLQAAYLKGVKDGRKFRWRDRYEGRPELQQAYLSGFKDGRADD